MTRLRLCIRRPKQSYSDTAIESEYRTFRDIYRFRLLSVAASIASIAAGFCWLVRHCLCSTCWRCIGGYMVWHAGYSFGLVDVEFTTICGGSLQ